MAEQKKVKEVDVAVVEDAKKSGKEAAVNIEASNFPKVIAKHSGKEYHFRACGMRDMPKLVELTEKVGSVIVDASSKEMKDSEVFTKEKLNDIAEMIQVGIVEDISNEQILEEFSIGNFPQVYQIVMDLNDFLLGMRNIHQTMVKTR